MPLKLAKNLARGADSKSGISTLSLGHSGIIDREQGIDMHRTVHKTSKLPLFRLDIDQVDALVAKLSKEFRTGGVLWIEIGAVGRGERLTFDSVDDLRAAEGLPASFGRFTIKLRGERSKAEPAMVTIDSGHYGVEAMAASSSAGWCASVIEETERFVAVHRLRIPGARFVKSTWAMAFLVAVLALGFTPRGAEYLGASWPLLLSWAAALTIVVALGVTAHRLPSAIIQVRPKETPWRKFSVEITLGLSFLGLIVSTLAAIAAFLALRK